MYVKSAGSKAGTKIHCNLKSELNLLIVSAISTCSSKLTLHKVCVYVANPYTLILCNTCKLSICFFAPNSV